MKNPLEYSLLEVDALLHGDPDGPHREFAHLLTYVHEKQKLMREYQVQATAQVIRDKQAAPPRRKLIIEDAALLDCAEIVTVVIEPEDSQGCTGSE